MGSYINIGFIASERKEKFLDMCVNLLRNTLNFELCSVKYPLDPEWETWFSCSDKNFPLYRALMNCYTDEMGEIIGQIKLGTFVIHDVLIKIKHFYNTSASCIFFEMPENNSMFSEIDVAEKKILELISFSSPLGFDYCFCDSEADIPQAMSKLNIKEQYSIFAKFKPNLSFEFKPWKINGLSDRQIDSSL